MLARLDLKSLPRSAGLKLGLSLSLSLARGYGARDAPWPCRFHQTRAWEEDPVPVNSLRAAKYRNILSTCVS